MNRTPLSRQVVRESARAYHPLWGLQTRGASAVGDEWLLGGKPTLMQEFGLCTAATGEPSRTIQDDFLGTKQPQFLASEEDAAAYYDAVLHRLRALKVPGALAWCYADYSPHLWGRPPLDRAIRERTFGLVRADGSEKPAVAVLRRHAAAPPPPPVEAPDVLGGLTPAAYYDDPARHFATLYARWCEALG